MTTLPKPQRITTILSFVRPFRFAFLNLFLCVAVTSFIGMFYPYIFSILIDEIFYHRNMDFFLIIVLTYGTIYVGETILHLILNSTWAYLMTRYLFDIRRKAFAHIHILQARVLDSSHTGDLVTIINRDADEFMNFIHWNIFYLFANILRFLTSITFVYLINAKLAGLMLIVIPISVYVTLFFGNKAKKVYQAHRTEYGVYISWLFEMLNGIREIKLFASEAHIRKVFGSYWKRLIRLKIQSSIIELLSERANSLITLLADLSLYVLAGILIVRGELSIGGFVAVIDYFLRGKRLLQNLNEAHIRIQHNFVSIDKLLRLLDEVTEQDSSSSEKLTLHTGCIEYKSVSFSYTDQHKVLQDLELVIEGGKKLALVRNSGSGKSTLAGLLLRFYEPKTGDIFIDGQNIQEINYEVITRPYWYCSAGTLSLSRKRTV